MANYLFKQEITIKATYLLSGKIEHMMLHISFKEIPPKDFVPRPCILHTIEQTNSLCQSYINPVYRVKRGKAFIHMYLFYHFVWLCWMKTSLKLGKVEIVL
jgi:hypothetical protein